MMLPVFLFSGFLDSGKTTFIQSMLEDPLADAILAGTIDAAREIFVKVQDENLIFE